MGQQLEFALDSSRNYESSTSEYLKDKLKSIIYSFSEGVVTPVSIPSAIKINKVFKDNVMSKYGNRHSSYRHANLSDIENLGKNELAFFSGLTSSLTLSFFMERYLFEMANNSEFKDVAISLLATYVITQAVSFGLGGLKKFKKRQMNLESHL